MNGAENKAPSLRRGLLYGLVAAVVVAGAGAAARESLGTIAWFALGTALFVGFSAYRAPAEPPPAEHDPDLGWIVCILRMLGRR
jgi:hypothetical protein